MLYERGEFLYLVDAANKARTLHGQVPGKVVERAERRKLVGAELPDEHRAAEITQAMLAEIS